MSETAAGGAVGSLTVAAPAVAWLAKQAKAAHVAQRVTKVPNCPSKLLQEGDLWVPHLEHGNKRVFFLRFIPR